VTEQAHPGVAVQERAEVQESVGPVWEGWVAPDPAQVPAENACVRNAERLLLMKQEHHATL
jgi:hypothetical protein